jgi:hypothetical protein
VTHEYLYFEQPLNKVNTQQEEGNWLIEKKNQNLVKLILGWDATFGRGLPTFIGMISLKQVVKTHWHSCMGCEVYFTYCLFMNWKNNNLAIQQFE